MQEEESLRTQFQAPMVQLRYEYAINILKAKLQMINAELTEKKHRQVIRTMSARIKTVDSIVKKLIKKERKVDFKTAADTLNDIAGIRIVCYFCDDIYALADAMRQQKDIRIIKEKDYVKAPKKSGYQSIHLIVGIPVSYNDWSEEIRVEIQIRSFAMDYWAELDTQMCYKKSAGEIEAVEREIRGYSDVIANVDNKMLKLRRRIEKRAN